MKNKTIPQHSTEHPNAMKLTLAKKTANYYQAKALLHYCRALQDALNNLREYNYNTFKHLNPAPNPSTLNRFPISGGICEYWPESAKEAVLGLVEDAQGTLQLSLDLWRASGHRRSTWLAEKERILGAGTTTF